MKGCVTVFVTKLKFQNGISAFTDIELSPVINSAPGMKAGLGLDAIGAGTEQYSQLIGKPLSSAPREDNLGEDKENERRRKRAKRANEIFRIVSRSAGLHPFFFDKFLVWSDYVEGKLNEEEFTERVREEVNIKAALLKN